MTALRDRWGSPIHQSKKCSRAGKRVVYLPYLSPVCILSRDAFDYTSSISLGRELGEWLGECNEGDAHRYFRLRRCYQSIALDAAAAATPPGSARRHHFS